MTYLSSRSTYCLRRLFSPSDVEVAQRLLEANPHARTERVALAAIRVSGGDLDRLRSTLAGDWRDAIVGAGFATDVTAHESWEPRLLTPNETNAWHTGKPLDGVRFCQGDTVRLVLPDPNSPQRGWISELVTVEPRPLYRVTLLDGSVKECFETSLESGWLTSA
jgi:hypothetical protein